MPRAVLLIADMEGICGVDALEPLQHTHGGYAAAARRMTQELAFVIGELRRQGTQQIRVVDSHRSGAPWNVDAAALGDVEFLVPDDSYEPAVFAGMDAVACVGMHAAAFTPGFAAHTVTVSPAWRVAGETISEAHLVRWLAAAQGVPLWFCSGDDVLRAQVGGAFVCTKTSAAIDRTTSHAWSDVAEAYRAVLAVPPAAVSEVPAGPIELRFRNAAQRDQAQPFHLEAHGPLSALVHGTTFRKAYTRALSVAEAVGEQDAASVTELFTRAWDR